MEALGPEMDIRIARELAEDRIDVATAHALNNRVLARAEAQTQRALRELVERSVAQPKGEG